MFSVLACILSFFIGGMCSALWFFRVHHKTQALLDEKDREIERLNRLRSPAVATLFEPLPFTGIPRR